MFSICCHRIPTYEKSLESILWPLLDCLAKRWFVFVIGLRRGELFCDWLTKQRTIFRHQITLLNSCFHFARKKVALKLKDHLLLKSIYISVREVFQKTLLSTYTKYVRVKYREGGIYGVYSPRGRAASEGCIRHKSQHSRYLCSSHKFAYQWASG